MQAKAIGGILLGGGNDPLPAPPLSTIASGETSRKWTLPSLNEEMTPSRWDSVMLECKQAPTTPGGKPVIWGLKYVGTVRPWLGGKVN